MLLNNNCHHKKNSYLEFMKFYYLCSDRVFNIQIGTIQRECLDDLTHGNVKMA